MSIRGCSCRELGWSSDSLGAWAYYVERSQRRLQFRILVFFPRFVTVIGFTCMANNLAPTSVTVGTCGLTYAASSEVFTFTISRVTEAFIRTSRAFGGPKNMRDFFCKCLLTPL